MMFISNLPSTVRKPVQPYFGGILANGFLDGQSNKYKSALRTSAKDYPLQPHTTRILRELATTRAIVSMYRNVPFDIHILGVSDGSVAFGYAMVCRSLYGEPIAKRNVKIYGVDRHSGLIELAKKGRIVCTETEKKYNEREPGSPLSGRGWDNYLSLSQAPDNFTSLKARYPELSQIEFDPVSSLSIGKGLDWYQVNRDILPEMSFEDADMRDYVKCARNIGRDKVFILSNAWAYMVDEEIYDQNPKAAEKDLLKVIQDLRNSNLGERVVIVTGRLEKIALTRHPHLLQELNKLGLTPFSENELRVRINNKKDARESVGKIWKLDTSTPCHYIA